MNVIINELDFQSGKVPYKKALYKFSDMSDIEICRALKGIQAPR
jgi:hypothetical protein